MQGILDNGYYCARLMRLNRKGNIQRGEAHTYNTPTANLGHGFPTVAWTQGSAITNDSFLALTAARTAHDRNRGRSEFRGARPIGVETCRKAYVDQAVTT